MPTAIVYDDANANLGPLTDLRSAFEVRTGALTNIQRLMVVISGVAERDLAGVYVPESIAALTRDRATLPVNDPASLEGDDVLLVNGRCTLPPDNIGELGMNQAITEPGTGHIVAARVDSKTAESILRDGSLPKSINASEHDEPCLLHWAWDVIRHRDAALDIDLAILLQRDTQDLPEGVIAIGEEDLCISPSAAVYPSVILDVEGGPIVIDDDATIRPGVTIIGPAYIGPGATILDKALIKAHTAIGPVCKIAGEVGGTIFQGFANKSHDGHLGDSWVGEWANLGAGTTNSNLLNTYAEVIATLPPGYRGAGERQRTGLQFLGAILGDHVKTAICTRLMTGSVIGTGAMLATTAAPPTSVAPFSWLTDERTQSYRLSKFVEVIETVMGRRKLKASEAYRARLAELHAQSGKD